MEELIKVVGRPVSHAALERLRESGDPDRLFLRGFLDLVGGGGGSGLGCGGPEIQEWLYHCVSGYRYVTLHRWDEYVGDGSSGPPEQPQQQPQQPQQQQQQQPQVDLRTHGRDYFFWAGMSMMQDAGNGGGGGGGRPVATACLTLAASFWKRGTIVTKSSTGIATATVTATSAFSSATSDRYLASRMGSLPHVFVDFGSLVNFLQQQQQQQQQQSQPHGSEGNDPTVTFVSALVGEFAGTSRSTVGYYNLSTEEHRRAHDQFQESVLDGLFDWTLQKLAASLSLSLSLSLSSDSALGGTVASSSAQVVTLLSDLLAWDFAVGGGWGRLGGGSPTTTTRIRLPDRWRDTLVRSDFVGAIFQLLRQLLHQQHLCGNIINSSSNTNTNSNSITNSSGRRDNKDLDEASHAVRQLILQLCSLTGFGGNDDGTSLAYASLMVDGVVSALADTVSVASMPSSSGCSQGSGSSSHAGGSGNGMVDLCQAVLHLVSNFGLASLSRLVQVSGTVMLDDRSSAFGRLVAAVADLGCRIWDCQLRECTRVRGDLDSLLDDDDDFFGWERRDEAWSLLLDASVLLVEDCHALSSSSSLSLSLSPKHDQQAPAKAYLAQRLSSALYEACAVSQIRIGGMEERFKCVCQDNDDDDDVALRERITESQWTERMEATAVVGRLNLGSALACLQTLWDDDLVPRLRLHLDGTSSSPEKEGDGAAVLEEACLFVQFVCHLLTDEDGAGGETPEIPAAVLECLSSTATDTASNVNKSVSVSVSVRDRLHHVVSSLRSLAEYHASRVAAEPNRLDLSPYLARTLVWFLRRWSAVYLVREEDERYVRESSAFAVALCLHYSCHWPQEREVLAEATGLLKSLAAPSDEERRTTKATTVVVEVPALETLVTLHVLSTAVTADEITVATYLRPGDNGAALATATVVDPTLLQGYRRIPHDCRGSLFGAILRLCCCGGSAESHTEEILQRRQQRASSYFDVCLRSLHDSFHALTLALSQKQRDPTDPWTQDRVNLCVSLYGGICSISYPSSSGGSDNDGPSHTIRQFVASVLPGLSGLMAYYASDLSICESLLRLFRDYAEQHLPFLSGTQSVLLFRSSADLLRAYGSYHLTTTSRARARGRTPTVTVTATVETEELDDQSDEDVLCAVQLLTHLGTKDFVDLGSGDGGSDSVTTDQVTETVFYGLQQILPLVCGTTTSLTTDGSNGCVEPGRPSLWYRPTLGYHVYSLVAFTVDTYPDRTCRLPLELYRMILESLAQGTAHPTDPTVAASCLRAVAAIAREHFKLRTDPHASTMTTTTTTALTELLRRLLVDVVFSKLVWDRTEAAGTALLPLVAFHVDAGVFGQVLDHVLLQGSTQKSPPPSSPLSTSTSTSSSLSSVREAFGRLFPVELLRTVVLSPGKALARPERIQFLRNFEAFVREVHAGFVVR